MENSKEFVSDNENILVDNEIPNENNTNASENDNFPNEHCGSPLDKEVRKSSPIPQKKESKRIRKRTMCLILCMRSDSFEILYKLNMSFFLDQKR